MDIQQYVTEASAQRSASSVQKELVVLKHLFSLAVEWEIIPVSLALGVKAPKLPAGRVRYLQLTELRALLEACRDGLREIVALAVSTGMRRGEIINLRYLDVDLSNRRIMLPQTKNGDGRGVYLNDMAAQVFSSVKWDENAKPTDRIFVDWTPSALTEAFRRLCRNLKLEDFKFHDLRHTAASCMRMSGADIHTVATLLGHKNLATAKRYQHLSPAFLVEAVGKLDAVFGSKSAENGGERYQDVAAKLALTDGGGASD